MAIALWLVLDYNPVLAFFILLILYFVIGIAVESIMDYIAKKRQAIEEDDEDDDRTVYEDLYKTKNQSSGSVFDEVNRNLESDDIYTDYEDYKDVNNFDHGINKEINLSDIDFKLDNNQIEDDSVINQDNKEFEASPEESLNNIDDELKNKASIGDDIQNSDEIIPDSKSGIYDDDFEDFKLNNNKVNYVKEPEKTDNETFDLPSNQFELTNNQKEVEKNPVNLNEIKAEEDIEFTEEKFKSSRSLIFQSIYSEEKARNENLQDEGVDKVKVDQSKLDKLFAREEKTMSFFEKIKKKLNL